MILSIWASVMPPNSAWDCRDCVSIVDMVNSIERVPVIVQNVCP